MGSLDAENIEILKWKSGCACCEAWRDCMKRIVAQHEKNGDTDELLAALRKLARVDDGEDIKEI